MESIRSTLVLIITFLALDLSAQNCINDNGTNSFVTPNQHPYTVFFKKQNSIFNHNNQNRAQSLDIFRARLREILLDGRKEPYDTRDVENIYKTYEQLCALAYESSIENYVDHKTNRHNTKFAYQLKAKAFVLLCATNKAGLTLGADTMAQIRTDIESMFASVEYEYPTSCKDCGWSSIGQYAAKRIIHYLQAYDLYVADAQLELTDNSKVNSIKCDIGIGLQQMIRDYWRNGERVLGAMSRNKDNHRLMFGGVLGLASVV